MGICPCLFKYFDSESFETLVNSLFYMAFYKAAIFDAVVKSLISDGAVKSSRSRLARFRRMQRT